MAEEYDILCEGCEHKRIENLAKHWCNHCEEGYCAECIKSHQVAKVLRQHHVIPISNYFETKAITINTICVTHGIDFECFCCQHNEILCLKCIQLEHSKCDNVMTIQDACKGVKKSTAMRHVEDRIESVSLNIENISKTQHQFKTSIQNQNHDIFQKVKQIRDKINNHLDELERKMLDELNLKCKKSVSKIGFVERRLQKLQHNICKIKNNLDQMKLGLADKQVFIGMKATEKLLVTEVEAVKIEMKDCKKYDFDICINSNIYSLLKELQSIGEIILEIQTTSMRYIEPNENMAQQCVARSEIDQITLEPIQTGESETML